MVNNAVEKSVTRIDYCASCWENKRRKVKVALRRGLRSPFNLSRNSPRLLAYRTLALYMDVDIIEASLERVIVATDAGIALVADAAVPDCETSSTRYGLQIKDREREMERKLESNAAVASIVADLLFFEPSQVWTSVRAACAACLKTYADGTEYPKLLCPESLQARKVVVRCMRDELRDLETGDVDL